MKGIFFQIAIIVLLSFHTPSFSAEITFSENFSSYSTIDDMEANGWLVDLYNHRATQPYLDYSISPNSFAVNELYYGTENFRYETSRIFLEARYRLPAPIDGDFNLSMDLSWLSPNNANKQEIWLMFQSPAGGHITGAQYIDNSTGSQGYLYSRFYNLGSSPATYSDNSTTIGSATSDGAATITISRQNGILTVRNELTEANGIPVGSNPPTAQVSTNTYTQQDFQIISIFLNAYKDASMGDLFIHNVDFTGESSTYQPPVAVPEPLSAVLLFFSCSCGILRICIRKKIERV